jgi:hypothetical protein
MSRGGWRRPAGYVAVAGVALAIAVFAFVLRFNALGGSLAGFDNDEFTVLSRVDMILAGEQPLRDFADGELRSIWPSLTYEVPAMAQRLWGRNLLVHALLTCGTLAFCAVLVFLLGRALSGSKVVAALAALAVAASSPKLYNYPKVLTLSVGALAIRWVTLAPSVPRIALLALWTVIAVLFRHDYGIYVAVGALVALIVCEPRPWIVPARRVATYGVLTALFSLPSVAWVTYYVGIPEYIRDVLASVTAEGRRLDAWPVFDVAAPLATSSLVAFTYYAFWVLGPIALLVAILRLWRSTRVPRGGADPAMGAGLAMMALVANYFLLRANLPARFGDAVVPFALLAAWLAAGVGGSKTVHVTSAVLVSLLLVAVCASFVQMDRLNREMATGRLNESIPEAIARSREVARELREQPPVVWTEKPVERTIAVSRYLAECTAPDDRVLVATYADEVPYFARRLFAGGQRRFASNVLKSEADQRRVLERLAHQSVPVVVTDPAYQEEFVPDYPLVARHIEANYRSVGVIDVDGRPVMRVWVEKARRALRTDPVLGFPCYR